MLFQWSITIPKNTSKTSPTTEIMPIAHGIITKMMVRPRTGHAALAHVIIKHHEQQIAPSNPDGDLHGDTFPIDWEEYYESYQPPYQLKLEGWSDDDSFSHTFTVYVAILPRKAILALAIVDAIKSAFGMLSPRRIFTGGG